MILAAANPANVAADGWELAPPMANRSICAPAKGHLPHAKA